MKKSLAKIATLSIIILMSIGFAAISTTLNIESRLSIASDFSLDDVFISKLIINGTLSPLNISEDKKSFTYDSLDFIEVGKIVNIEYEIINRSYKYDANISVSCVPITNDFITVKNEVSSTTIQAQSKENGSLSGEVKVKNNNTITTFSCSINVEGTGRTEEAEHRNVCVASQTGLIIGDKITCDTESFYVIGFEADYIKMLSEYNLEIGSIATGTSTELISNPSNIQNSKALGYVTATEPRYGVTKFSETSSEYIDSLAEGYALKYEDYLINNLGMDITTMVSLPTIEDLEALGCSKIQYSCSQSTYPFVYQTSYWTRSVVSSNNLWKVNYGGYLGDDYYSNSSISGIRPVVKIPITSVDALKNTTS